MQNFVAVQFIARCRFKLLVLKSSSLSLKEFSSELLRTKTVDSVMNETKFYFSCSNISGMLHVWVRGLNWTADGLSLFWILVMKRTDLKLYRSWAMEQLWRILTITWVLLSSSMKNIIFVTLHGLDYGEFTRSFHILIVFVSVSREL